jgi:hypothetical protein
MLMTVVVTLLAQSPELVKVAIPGLSYVGVQPAVGDIHLERFATVLGNTPGLDVTTRRDIEQLLGLERQRALLGCADDSTSCLAELAGGLGVEAVVSGSLAKTGGGYTVTLRVLRARDGAVIASASERLKDELALADWLDDEAPRLGAKITAAFGRTPTASTRWVRFVPGIAGVVLVAGGSALVGASLSDASSLSEGNTPVAEIPAPISRGQTLQTSGFVLIGVGAAGIAASALWLALGGSASPQVAIVPVQQGAVFTFGGSLP